MGVRRIATTSAACLLAGGAGLAITPAAHAIIAVYSYDCASVTTHPPLTGPGGGLGETAAGINCIAANGAPTNGVNIVQATFYVGAAAIVTCSDINADYYPGTVLGARCSPP